jgi:translation initiation factor 4G
MITRHSFQHLHISFRSGKPPTGSAQSFRPKTGASPGTPGYAVQRQPSRELARGNSLRDRENAMESLRKTTAGNVVTSPNNATNSREGSRNVSREQSRNASRESSVNERICNPNITESETKASTQTTTANDTSFDEEKVKARVHSLIEEYTENYSDNNDRPVKEAVEDLVDFCPPNTDHQAIIVQELFTNVLEAKSRARKAVGHLLDVALDKNIISNEGFVSGFKLIIEAAPDYAVDIPLIWQYIGEIVGALIGAPTSKMVLLKPILQSIPDEKSKQFFQYIIRYAVEFSSKSHIQRYWQSSGFSLNDLLKSDSVDSSFTNEYNWLSDPVAAEPISPPIKENLSPRADLQLVKLFKSFNDQGTKINDAEIIAYIHKVCRFILKI